MRKILFSLITLSLFFTACKKDNGTVEIKFLAEYDGAPLEMFKPVNYGDKQIFITQSDFYITNIELSNSENTELLQEVGFVDFTNSNIDLNAALAGIDLTFDDIPPGTYNKLTFSIGVQPEMNANTPVDYDSDNPLSNSSYYWSNWESYIFSKFQGKMDIDGSENFELGFLFHTGKDDMLRSFEVDIDLEVSEDNNPVIEIIVDHKKLLEVSDGELFDIQASPANHNLDNLAPLEMLVNNYQKALKIAVQ